MGYVNPPQPHLFRADPRMRSELGWGLRQNTKPRQAQQIPQEALTHLLPQSQLWCHASFVVYRDIWLSSVCQAEFLPNVMV